MQGEFLMEPIKKRLKSYFSLAKPQYGILFTKNPIFSNVGWCIIIFILHKGYRNASNEIVRCRPLYMCGNKQSEFTWQNKTM
jgi:hypothetical protein